jgi:hypothetical protein
MQDTSPLCRRFWSGLAGIVVMGFAVPAAFAIPITYVFSGPATGTLGATPFTGAQVTVTATADTVNITSFMGNPGLPCIDLTAVTINVAGIGSATATGGNKFVENKGIAAWGLLTGDCTVAAGDWLDQNNPLAAGYNLTTSLGPTTGTQFAGGSVPTTSGTLTFTAVPLTFQATLGQVGPIPTLSQWVLLLLGSVLAAVGIFFLRGRRLANR